MSRKTTKRGKPQLADIVTLDFGEGRSLRIDTTTDAGRKKLARILHVVSIGRSPRPASSSLDSDKPRASEDFLKALPRIAWRLQTARIDGLEGTQDDPQGYKDFLTPQQIYEDDGIGFTVGGISAKHLIELAEILKLIVAGVDARRLFRQDKRNKPRSRSHFARALTYWEMRASDPTANDAEAVVAAQLQGYGKPPSPASIRKIAQKYRDKCLDALEGRQRTAYPIKLPLDLRQQAGVWPASVATIDVRPLREHLRRKSPHIRDDVDEFLGGKHPRVRRRA